EAFWGQVEERLLTLLREYAGRAQNGRYVARRLFARDGMQGLRFLDLLRQKYDVVLMNPPFGAASKLSKAYIEKHYPRTKNDLFAAFVERGLELLHKGGKLGAITSRTGFFLTSFQKWREEILLKKARPTLVTDLGAGVLDTAMVETAAYCLEVVE
ncbi:MAG: SAM-dependent methyltransferase, partial [Bacillaceae bacterium]|nr:SAM-dependent methyltransferase [Bacillaceae bacterium]